MAQAEVATEGAPAKEAAAAPAKEAAAAPAKEAAAEPRSSVLQKLRVQSAQAHAAAQSAPSGKHRRNVQVRARLRMSMRTPAQRSIFAVKPR